jgi:plasmid stabilization system protein ParE
MVRGEKVIFMDVASQSIAEISAFIEALGYPKSAHKFIEMLHEFGEKLIAFPNAYPICQNPILAKRKIRCAVFKKNCIFVFRVEKEIVVIYNVIHGRRNPIDFS